MNRYPGNLPRFPTAVIGSLPRPAWLLDVMQEYLAGRLNRDEWDRRVLAAMREAERRFTSDRKLDETIANLYED